MIKDDLIRMAALAGYDVDDDDDLYAPASGRYGLDPRLEKFSKLVAAAEREACARLCEEREEYQMPIPCPDGIAGCCVAHFVRGSKIKDGKECATAIRARGDKHD